MAESVTNLVGNRIRFFREQKGLSLKALADDVGISSSMLSQIENNRANPSLNTVWQIADALSISPFRLFIEEETEDLDVAHSRERFHLMRDGVDTEILSPTRDTDIHLYMLRLDRGGKAPRQPIGREADICAYVMDGNLTLQMGDQFFNISTGDSVQIRANIKHQWTNTGTSNARIIYSSTELLY